MYQVNSEILAVWKKHENIDAPFMKRIPLFYTKPKTNCLLYVGFNPSFNEKFMSKLKAESVKSGKSYSFDYNTKTEFSEENINEVAEYEAGASIPGHEFFYEPYIVFVINVLKYIELKLLKISFLGSSLVSIVKK